MKNSTCASLLILAGVLAPLSAIAQLKLVQHAEIPGNYTGKFDHFAIDTANHKLFVAATGNHSVEVLDLSSGKVSQSITGLGKPHGLAWIPDTGRFSYLALNFCPFCGRPLSRGLWHAEKKK